MAQGTTIQGAQGPGRTARVLLLAMMLATCYLDFFGYKRGNFDDPHALDARLTGHVPAPDQYRLGVYVVAHEMVIRLHMRPTMALGILDGLSGLLAAFLAFRLLEESLVYRRASASVQWFGAAAFLLLVSWFAAWLLWLQKPETLPAAALAVLLLWLWEPRTTDRGRWLRAVALVIVSLALASFREDLACLLNAGVLVFALLRKDRLSLPRPAAIAVSLLTALAAAGIQLWMMRVAYPHATYAPIKMWQLWPNLKHGSRYPPFAIFLLPLGWMTVAGARRGFARDTAGRAFLIAAAGYLALWLAIGKIDEVRIFFPLALALTPLTVQMAMLRVERDAASPT
jgi:hypothetical protein